MTATENSVFARLDAIVTEHWRETIFYHDPLTAGRARTFVLQHRLNSRYRNSVLKVRVASQVPHWDLRLRLLGGVSQEILADHEFGHGKPHWQIMKELGLAVGLSEAEIDNAQPIPSTRLAWYAWEGLMSNHHWLEGLIAATIAERVNLPGYGEGEFREIGFAAREVRRWGELFGLTPAQLEFWSLHAEADKEHSSLGWEAVARYAEELRMVDAALQAARDALHIWRHYFNGIAAAGDALDRELAGNG
jgi:pyrroloquinoline quinone (PQQ) biosynthesis protein C